ncbi:hypothetical protein ACO1O0_006618 [Amphichorda felina]
MDRNLDICKDYMTIAYSPSQNKGASSVAHLCHPDSWFWAPATFPGCETPMDYAESHAAVMASVANLRIVRFDQAWAKDGHVLLRYTAQGSHCGKPYRGIKATGRRAQWSAAAIFEVEDGKIRSFTKDWDQKTMQVRGLASPDSRVCIESNVLDRFNSDGHLSRTQTTHVGTLRRLPIPTSLGSTNIELIRFAPPSAVAFQQSIKRLLD